MGSRRIVAVALVVACAVLAARVAAPSSGGHFHYSAALACGVERWKVKTLQDHPRLLRAHAIPMSQLVSHERPTPLPGTRLPFERHTKVEIVNDVAPSPAVAKVYTGIQAQDAAWTSSACLREPLAA
jgi:hypothetical protein